jgi:hypothetical protein
MRYFILLFFAFFFLSLAPVQAGYAEKLELKQTIDTKQNLPIEPIISQKQNKIWFKIKKQFFIPKKQEYGNFILYIFYAHLIFLLLGLIIFPVGLGLSIFWLGLAGAILESLGLIINLVFLIDLLIGGYKSNKNGLDFPALGLGIIGTILAVFLLLKSLISIVLGFVLALNWLWILGFGLFILAVLSIFIMYSNL